MKKVGDSGLGSRCRANILPTDKMIRNFTGYEFEMRDELQLCHIMDPIKEFKYVKDHVDLKTVVKYEKSTADLNGAGNEVKFNSNPIETIGPLTRCVSYFSNLFMPPNGKSTVISTHKLHKSGEVIYVLRNSSDVMIPCVELQVSVESEMSLPLLNQFQGMSLFGQHQVLFSSISVESLQPPYDTNCQKYSKGFYN